MKKRITLIAVAIALFSISPKMAEAVTLQEIGAQLQVVISQAQQTRQNLLQYLDQNTDVPSECKGIVFMRNLKLGASGRDVKCLQAILNKEPDTKIAQIGPGSSGNETRFFGPLTRLAVIRFQEKYKEEVLDPLGTSRGTGFMEANTRMKLNSILRISREN